MSDDLIEWTSVLNGIVRQEILIEFFVFRLRHVEQVLIRLLANLTRPHFTFADHFQRLLFSVLKQNREFIIFLNGFDQVKDFISLHSHYNLLLSAILEELSHCHVHGAIIAQLLAIFGNTLFILLQNSFLCSFIGHLFIISTVPPANFDHLSFLILMPESLYLRPEVTYSFAYCSGLSSRAVLIGLSF